MLLTILKQILIILAGVTVVIAAFILLLQLAEYESNKTRRFWGDTPIRAQLLYLVLVFAVIGIVWFFSDIWRDWYYEEGPRPYASVEAAAEDGCVVLAWNGIVAGREHWEEFLACAESWQPAQISIAHSDGGAVGVVHELRFDGFAYHYTENTRFLHQDSQQQTYPYLLCLTYKPPENKDTYSQKVTWVLTDKADLTAEEQHWAFADENKDYSLETILTEYHWLTE